MSAEWQRCSLRLDIISPRNLLCRYYWVVECIKHGTETGLMVCVGQPPSRRTTTDAALFEEVLWQATAEDADNELAEQNAGEMVTVKEEGW